MKTRLKTKLCDVLYLPCNFCFVFILFTRLSISFFITSSQMSSVLVSMRLKILMILIIVGMNDVMCGTVSYHSASPHCQHSILCRQPPLRKGGSQSCPDQTDEVGVRGMYNGGRSRKIFLESNGYSWIIQIQWKKRVQEWKTDTVTET